MTKVRSVILVWIEVNSFLQDGLNLKEKEKNKKKNQPNKRKKEKACSGEKTAQRENCVPEPRLQEQAKEPVAPAASVAPVGT